MLFQLLSVSKKLSSKELLGPEEDLEYGVASAEGSHVHFVIASLVACIRSGIGGRTLDFPGEDGVGAIGEFAGSDVDGAVPLAAGGADGDTAIGVQGEAAAGREDTAINEETRWGCGSWRSSEVRIGGDGECAALGWL